MSGAPDANLGEARRWLKQAHANLASARCLGDGRLWAQGCFFCQQAAETALKAILIRAGERDLRTHSTARLIKRAIAYESAFEKFLEDTPLLDRHYVGTRYPNGISDELTGIWEEKDFRHAQVAAAAIVERAERILSGA